MTDRNPPRINRRKALGLLSIGVVAVGLGAGGVALGPALGPALGQSAGNGSADAVAPAPQPLPTATVMRGDLVETAEAAGTIGYGATWDIPIEATGVVTDAPKKGSIVEPGQPLIEVAGRPVFLAEGATPLYRSLDFQSASSKRLRGDDVTQLQRFLADQGFDDDGRMIDDGEFGRSTERAVKAWQKDVGFEQTGTIDRTQLVFHPGAVRVEIVPRVGADFERLEVTDATQEVVAEFEPDQRPFVPVGAEVTLQLDTETSVTGTVDETASTISADGESKIEVRIVPASPMPTEAERVKVVASRVRASDVLIVPARAVLALASGGYGLEVVTPAGPELRRIELGAVVDDQIEITGDFDEGDDVYVARQVGEEQ